MIHLGIVVPAPRGSRVGNRVTALRWAGILRWAGYRVSVVNHLENQAFDGLIALHAVKSHDAIVQFKESFPHRPIFVALTGTDVFQDGETLPQLEHSLELADRVIALQAEILRHIPDLARRKSRVIFQSFTLPEEYARPTADAFEVCVLGHLRAVKDPFLAAKAVRQLPEDSRLKVVQVGGALAPEFAEQARAEAATNPRYSWVGELPRKEAVARLARCRVLVMSSLSEGGPSAVSEAIVCAVPVLSTPTSGVVGLLGDDYPGYFPFGDCSELKRLLLRCENDSDYLRTLQHSFARIRPELTPEAERQRWLSLLAEVGFMPQAN